MNWHLTWMMISLSTLGSYKEEEVFRLIRCKGVYPYKYMDSWKKFEETSLPPKMHFTAGLGYQ